MNGKSIRDKGLRGERDLVNLCKSYGREARRQPLSGALSHREFKNDVMISLTGSKVLTCEVKLRKKFSDYPLMETAKDNGGAAHIPALIKKGDRKPFLITMYFEDFLNLIQEVSNNG